MKDRTRAFFSTFKISLAEAQMVNQRFPPPPHAQKMEKQNTHVKLTQSI